MKTAKILVVVSVITFSMTTSVFASWWNPFTWFHKKVTSVQQVRTVAVEQKMPLSKSKQTNLLEIGSTVSFNLPLYIVELRSPAVNIDDNSEIKYALSCYKDRTKQDNELLISDAKLVVTKVGHTQGCVPDGGECYMESFYISKSQSGKLVQVTPHDITYNFNNCKERSLDYK